MFKECRFYAGHVILKEGESQEYMYLIAEGQVKLESSNNPFRRREYDDQNWLKNVKL